MIPMGNFKNSECALTRLPAWQQAVRFILNNASLFSWQYQGLGMLRLDLGNDVRLHIWDPNRAVKDVSTIHDHMQWGLESTIVFGQLTNFIFEESPFAHDDLHHCAQIKAGVGGGIEHRLADVRLYEKSMITYRPGDTYCQEPNVIHESKPRVGCVTIVRRFRTKNTDAARVFWDHGTEWVSAEPRPATAEEVEHFVDITRFSQT